MRVHHNLILITDEILSIVGESGAVAELIVKDDFDSIVLSYNDTGTEVNTLKRGRVVVMVGREDGQQRT